MRFFKSKPSSSTANAQKSLSETPNPNQPSVVDGQSSNGWRDGISTILIILIAPIIALILVFFVFQSYQVDGPSMQPTLHNNDRLIVWKLPKTWSRITGHPYIPNRGDIVIFEEPSLDNKQLIKRVIGLPGDRIVVNNGILTVFNSAHPNGFRPDTTLPYSKAVTIPVTSGNVNLVIPPGQIYVCGDNRPDSLDSRVFGTVPANDIVGKLVIRILPLNKAERF